MAVETLYLTGALPGTPGRRLPFNPARVRESSLPPPYDVFPAIAGGRAAQAGGIP